MKLILILTLTFLSLTALGQDTNSGKKILIGFNFSPDYANRVLKNGDGSSSTDLVIKSRNDIEIAKFGFTTGLNVWFNFSQRIGLETGIQFSNKGYKAEDQNLVYFPPNPGSPTKVKIIYAYQYIGVPLKAKFSFTKNKIHFIAGIGFVTNFLLNIKQTTTMNMLMVKQKKNPCHPNQDLITLTLLQLLVLV